MKTTWYEVISEKIPESVAPFRIVQLSDVHDSMFGENHEQVVRKVKMITPHAIFITGDLIDSNRYNLEQSLQLIRALQYVAPLYYVTGNHEIATNDTDHIKEELQLLGVHVLSNEAMVINTLENELIAIGGIEDPLSSVLEEKDAIQLAIQEAFRHVPDTTFKMLLSHRPEHFDLYAENHVDLTFSGHAHGGQFRIPGIGGLIAPGQGWFPKFTSGIYERNDHQMVVSRGLGNSIIPIRLFNQPEIVVVTLFHTKN
ncbi:metallophosphoesterase [Sporosarcina sp. HYO08]|uniref:metallophosphoesterase n=1 Tax=Sporosarcina sp. HYO08 TaxID=1759557 RepID=UPI0020A45731|nr:metallophosphoesterase [Sporosarcina sp. HYO08]